MNCRDCTTKRLAEQLEWTWSAAVAVIIRRLLHQSHRLQEKVALLTELNMPLAIHNALNIFDWCPWRARVCQCHPSLTPQQTFNVSIGWC